MRKMLFAATAIAVAGLASTSAQSEDESIIVQIGRASCRERVLFAV